MSRRAPRVTPARRVAFAVVRRTFESGAYTDRAFEAEAARAELDPRERALATRLAYETVQRRGTLDHLIAALAGRPVEELDPPPLAALRLGLTQILFLGGVADHAAVDQSVELAKAGGGGGARLVNAVLRRAIRDGPALLSALHDDDPEAAAVRHSVPAWIARLWWAALGPEEARAALRGVNAPAEAAVRANGLLATAGEVRARLAARGVAAGRVAGLPEALVLGGPFDARGSDLHAAGSLMPQSRAAMLVARALAPAPGARVLDLCAAPGGKTTHLAALVGPSGSVLAVERHPGRAAALRRTVERMRASAIVHVETADALGFAPPAFSFAPDGPVDAVLVDPPCSGLGTLRSRPDLRWRARAEAVPELAARQRALLLAGAKALRPGGRLLYATCTISPEENERVVAAASAADAGLAIEDLGAEWPGFRHPADPRFLLTLPHRHGTDGFFLARLRRMGAPGGQRPDAP